MENIAANNLKVGNVSDGTYTIYQTTNLYMPIATLSADGTSLRYYQYYDLDGTQRHSTIYTLQQ